MQPLNTIIDPKLFRVLGEPVRIEILEVLARRGPMDIGRMAQLLPKDRSVISRHLSAMRRIGFLQAEKRGRHTVYRINPDTMKQRLDDVAEGVARYLDFWRPGVEPESERPPADPPGHLLR